MALGTNSEGMAILVGNEVGLVEIGTVTDMSHARLTRMNRERNKEVLFMAKSPFILHDSQPE